MKRIILVIVLAVLSLVLSVNVSPPPVEVQAVVESSEAWDYENAEAQDFDKQFEVRMSKNGGLRK